jgi:hypothetical protein
MTLKGMLIIADSARRHEDGTFSLLRGGVDRVEIAPGAETVHHRGSVVARIRGEHEDQGKHSFRLSVVDSRGTKIAPDLDGEFEIPANGASAVLAFDFGIQVQVAKLTAYSFVLFLNGKETDSWKVDIATQATSRDLQVGAKK